MANNANTNNNRQNYMSSSSRSKYKSKILSNINTILQKGQIA